MSLIVTSLLTTAKVNSAIDSKITKYNLPFVFSQFIAKMGNKNIV